MKTGIIVPNLGLCRDGMKPCLFGMIVLGFSTVVAGCATPPPPQYQHWLSAQEDADFRAQCEGKNCVIVPGDLWERIKEALAKAMGTAI